MGRESLYEVFLRVEGEIRHQPVGRLAGELRVCLQRLLQQRGAAPPPPLPVLQELSLNARPSRIPAPSKHPPLPPSPADSPLRRYDTAGLHRMTAEALNSARLDAAWQGQWAQRAVVVDWLTEVSADYLFKRDTLHCAVGLLDRLAAAEPVQQLQLAGATCLFLAAKAEEVSTPTLESLLLVADNAFSAAQVLALEPAVLRAAQFRLALPSLSVWASYATLQWDCFCRRRRARAPHFRQPDLPAYRNLRQLLQRLDCALLDARALHFPPALLVAAFLLLELGCATAEPLPPQSLRTLYADFLRAELNLDARQLDPPLAFALPFFALQPRLDPPTAARVTLPAVLASSFEEFLAYQTYDPLTLPFLIRTIQS